MVTAMARRKQLDVEEIIAKNPKVNRVDLEKGAEVLKELQKSGAVRPSTYDLETADRNKTIRYSGDEVCIVRGATIRLTR
jgi:uridine kinase